MFSRKDWNVEKDERQTALLDMYAQYDKCDRCNALAKNPCRNSDFKGSKSWPNKPHPERKMLS
jgi:hypothetical protein